MDSRTRATLGVVTLVATVVVVATGWVIADRSGGDQNTTSVRLNQHASNNDNTTTATTQPTATSETPAPATVAEATPAPTTATSSATGGSQPNSAPNSDANPAATSGTQPVANVPHPDPRFACQLWASGTTIYWKNCFNPLGNATVTYFYTVADCGTPPHNPPFTLASGRVITACPMALGGNQAELYASTDQDVTYGKTVGPLPADTTCFTAYIPSANQNVGTC